MTAATSPTSEPTTPNPPRFRWLKRLLVAGLLSIVSLTAIRIWWGAHARQLLDAELAARRARGERVLPEDFATSTIPDSDNAAVILTNAGKAIDEDAPCPSSSNLSFANYFPYPKSWMLMTEKAVVADQKALTLARHSRQCSGADWQIPMRWDAVSSILPNYGPVRSLANLLGDAAVLSHLNGDDREALERAVDLLHLSSSVDQQPVLIGHLVAMGIEAVATYRICLIAPRLTISDAASPAPPATAPATRTQVQALTARLLDEDSHRATVAKMFEGERAMQLSMLQDSSARNIVLRPLFQLQTIQIVRAIDQHVTAATQPTWPAVRTAWSTTAPSGTGGMNAITQMWNSILMPSMIRAMQADFRIVLVRRAAAVSLASRLYQIDHKGAFPPSLQALVPKYLPAVPLDPFAADGRPLAYILADGGSRPIVYSVGEDGADNTTPQTVFPRTPMYGWELNAIDQWTDLSRFEPASTHPATQESTDSAAEAGND